MLLSWNIWVVVKIMVPLWIPIIIRNLLLRVPFDNYQYVLFVRETVTLDMCWNLAYG